MIGHQYHSLVFTGFLSQKQLYNRKCLSICLSVWNQNPSDLRYLVNHISDLSHLWFFRTLISQISGFSELWSLRSLISQVSDLSYLCYFKSLILMITDIYELWSIWSLINLFFGVSDLCSLRYLISQIFGHESDSRIANVRLSDVSPLPKPISLSESCLSAKSHH